MNIKYRIISVNEADHSFVVRYYTDVVSEFDLSADWNRDGTPILGEDGKPRNCRTDYNITLFNVEADQEEIEKQIQYNAPVDWLKLQEEVYSKPKTKSLTSILDNLHKEKSFEHKPVVIEPPAKKELTADEVNDLLKKIKTNG